MYTLLPEVTSIIKKEKNLKKKFIKFLINIFFLIGGIYCMINMGHGHDHNHSNNMITHA